LSAPAVKFAFQSGADVPAPRSKSKKRKRTARHRAVRLGASTRRVGKLFEELVAVQARLRAPGGCPWDREQTHLTLRTYLIEEAYEVLDALEAGDSPNLAEELGDLLLQVLFHADLARESGAFDISDVVTGITDKMIRRHPHVFGNVKAETAGDVLKNWAQLKAKEKRAAAAKGKGAITQASSQLDGVPRHLPALLEAYQLSRRASQVGFDWDHVDGIFDKLMEETSELRTALASTDRQAVEEEVGDLFFSMVNLARFLELDPEVILKKANRKFKKRFQVMESIALVSKVHLADLSKEELEQLWQSAKSKVQPQNNLVTKS
jgi:tetrapyrrole methylase family protein/MazG family protein